MRPKLETLFVVFSLCAKRSVSVVGLVFSVRRAFECACARASWRLTCAWRCRKLFSRTSYSFVLILNSPRSTAPPLRWDNVGGEAFNIPLFWIEDREWLHENGGRDDPGLYAAPRTPDADLTKPTGVLPVQRTVDHVSLSSVACIHAKNQLGKRCIFQCRRGHSFLLTPPNYCQSLRLQEKPTPGYDWRLV